MNPLRNYLRNNNLKMRDFIPAAGYFSRVGRTGEIDFKKDPLGLKSEAFIMYHALSTSAIVAVPIILYLT